MKRSGSRRIALWAVALALLAAVFALYLRPGLAVVLVGEDPATEQFYRAAAQFYERIAADIEGAHKETDALNAFCAKKG